MFFRSKFGVLMEYLKGSRYLCDIGFGWFISDKRWILLELI